MLHNRIFLTLLAMGLSLVHASYLWAGGQAEAREILYAAKAMPIHSGPGDAGAKTGRLYTASRIDVLKRRSGWLQIAVRAWHQEGAERVLYALPGKRILVSVLKKTAVSDLRQVGEVMDVDTDILWKQVTFEGWIQAKGLVPALEDLWTPAWELFATRCTVCHQRRIPHHYTANNWRSLIKIMGPRTGLQKPKQQLILKFLQYHASDMVDDHASGQPDPSILAAGAPSVSQKKAAVAE